MKYFFLRFDLVFLIVCHFKIVFPFFHNLYCISIRFLNFRDLTIRLLMTAISFLTKPIVSNFYFSILWVTLWHCAVWSITFRTHMWIISAFKLIILETILLVCVFRSNMFLRSMLFKLNLRDHLISTLLLIYHVRSWRGIASAVIRLRNCLIIWHLNLLYFLQ